MKFVDPQPPAGVFSNKVVKPNKITLDDDVKSRDSAVDYPYEITVTKVRRTSARWRVRA